MNPSQLVRTVSGVPVVADFANKDGTPIVIDSVTGNSYALIGGVVTLINTVATAASIAAAVAGYRPINTSVWTAESPVTLSGTTISISTTIPSWAKQIMLLFDSVSTNGTNDILIQVGDSGGFETTVYVSESVAVLNASSSISTTSTSGYVVFYSSAAASVSGSMTLTLSSANTWIENHTFRSSTTVSLVGAGRKTLSDTLTSIQATIVGGVNTFDVGSITPLYQ